MPFGFANSIMLIVICEPCPSKTSNTGREGGIISVNILNHLKNSSLVIQPFSLMLNTVFEYAPTLRFLGTGHFLG